MLSKGLFDVIQNKMADVPFYSQRKSYMLDDFYGYPLIDKADVLSNYSDFFSSKLIDVSCINTKTSGSSGAILSVLWKESDYIRSLFYLWKMRGFYGILPTDRFCTLHLNYTKNGRIINNKVIINNNCISLSKCFVDDESMEFYLNCISEFRPKWFFIQPSFLYAFCIYLRKFNKSFPEFVQMIELSGEYCSLEMINFFEQELPNITIVNMYGMQEFNGIAYGKANKLKVLENNVIVEILDDQNRKCNSNEEGNIIVTTLTNELMPLIRYKTGDRGFFDTQHLLTITKARCNDSIIVNGVEYDGSVFWGIINIVNTEFLENKIKQFRIDYKDYILYFNLVMEHSGLSNNYIADIIQDVLNNRMHWENMVARVNIVDYIAPFESSNKIKYFINYSQE